MKQNKVIKRYANRKLYDTERSCYVTLDEISQMIKDGDDVQVLDNKTKDDLTAVTLAQIIVEEEKKMAKMPLKLLRTIIQTSTTSMGEAINDFVSDRVVDPVKRIREEAERRVDALLKRDAKAEGDVDAPASEVPPAGTTPGAPETEPVAAAAETKHSAIQEMVTSTSEAFETWQRRIDERVRDALGKAGRPDLDGLRQRVTELETRIRDLEALRAQAGKAPPAVKDAG